MIQAGQLMWRETYTYDRNGNRASKTTPWGTIRYEYDAENRLIKKGDVVYTNDKDGNTLSEKGLRYEAKYQYNGQNRMAYSEVKSHVEKTHITATYGYDALGRRTLTQSVTGQTLRTLYDGRGFEVIREGETFRDGSLTTRNAPSGIPMNSGNRLQSNQPTGERYRWISEDNNEMAVNEDGYTVTGTRYGGRGVTLYGNGEAVAVSYSSSAGNRTTYLGKDLLGSVRSTTAESGLLEERYEYDAFGQPYAGDLSGGMNLGYLGKPYDAATGLYNYGYRDYKPQAARFTTVDPVRDGNNWYVYVNNDPVNWIDLWGLAASDTKSKWIDNGDGTYTALAGATLSGLYGSEWAELSGFTRDPRTLQIGETVGFVKPTQPASVDITLPTPQSTSNNIPVTEQQNNSSRVTNIATGVGEMAGGIVLVAGSVFFAIYTKGEYMGLAYSFAMAGVTLSAYGLVRTIGKHDKPVFDDIKNILTEPIPTYFRVYNYLKEK